MKCADRDAPARFMSAPECSRGVDTTPLGEMIDELAELRELAKTNYQALTKETLR